MNEYYQTKASLPRQVKNSISLREALENWREHRLMGVANACEGLDDPFRTDFGKVHVEFAKSINVILEEKNLQEAVTSWYASLKDSFDNMRVFNKGGGKVGALGICGAELEQIIKLGLP